MRYDILAPDLLRLKAPDLVESIDVELGGAKLTRSPAREGHANSS